MKPAPGFVSWQDTLAAGLNTQRMGRAFRHLPECSSTNDELAHWADEGAPEGAVITADAQAAGRGRLGRAWHSPPGANLYVSILLRPSLPMMSLPPLTLLTGAVAAEVLAAAGAPARLKWPNDIMLPADGRMKKAGGILIEAATSQGRIRHVIVGIGLNVGPVDFPPGLREIAVSLGNLLSPPPSRMALLQALLNTFEAAYEAFSAEGAPYALARWRRFAWLGQLCRVARDTTEVEGRAVGVDETGALLLEDKDGKRHAILSGEVITKL